MSNRARKVWPDLVDQEAPAVQDLLKALREPVALRQVVRHRKARPRAEVAR